MAARRLVTNATVIIESINDGGVVNVNPLPSIAACCLPCVPPALLSVLLAFSGASPGAVHLCPVS